MTPVARWTVRARSGVDAGVGRVQMMFYTEGRQAKDAGRQASPDEQWARDGEEWRGMSESIQRHRRRRKKKKKSWKVRFSLRGHLFWRGPCSEDDYYGMLKVLVCI